MIDVANQEVDQISQSKQEVLVEVKKLASKLSAILDEGRVVLDKSCATLGDTSDI